jgi:hypothetical protein
VNFMKVGDSEEIKALFEQVHNLFGAAKEKWKIGADSIIGAGPYASEGNGIACEYMGQKPPSFEIAMNATQVAGIPCAERSPASGPEIRATGNGEILIRVQTRIAPE